MDLLDDYLDKVIKNPKTNLAIVVATLCGCKLLNKYYSLSDESLVCCITMSTSSNSCGISNLI
jgi:hypothetical protein